YSVTSNLLSSPSAPTCSATPSRLALRYFAFRLLPRPAPPASFACVSRILSCISFWSISLSSRRLSVERGPKRLLPWPPAAAGRPCPGGIACPPPGLLKPPPPCCPEPGRLNPPCPW